MATSKIQQSAQIVREVLPAKTIEWSSTTNPAYYGNVDISKAGYTPIAISGSIGGSLGSFVLISALRIISDTEAFFEARMVSNTPSSLTQNNLQLTVTYMKN